MDEYSITCSCCGSEKFTTRLETNPKSPHFARSLCAVCGKFHKWISKPENRSRSEFIDSLLNHPLYHLKPWEKKFLNSIRSQKKLSEKQLNTLDGIARRHFGLSFSDWVKRSPVVEITKPP